MQCDNGLRTSPLFQHNHSQLCTTVRIQNGLRQLVPYETDVVSGSLRWDLGSWWSFSCQRPRIPDWRYYSPTPFRHRPMGGYGSGQVDLTSISYLLAPLWGGLEFIHWVLLPISSIHPYDHEQFQSEAYLLILYTLISIQPCLIKILLIKYLAMMG